MTIPLIEPVSASCGRRASRYVWIEFSASFRPLSRMRVFSIEDDQARPAPCCGPCSITTSGFMISAE